MIRSLRPAALLAILVACGDDTTSPPDPSTDTGTDPAVDVADSSDDARDERDAPPDAVADGPDTPSVEGLPIPFATHLGPCTREVRVGSDGFLLYSFVYDYELAPDTVTATRSTGGELDVVIKYLDVDTRRQCAKPPEEPHAAFVDIVGCPNRVIVDTDDNGLISPLDLAMNYAYDPDGSIEGSDRFDWRNTYTGSTWFYDYNADGALLGGRRVDADADAVILHVSYPGELRMILEYDDQVDGSVDTRISYDFNSDGHVVEAAVEEADPGTGELTFRSRSAYTYDCWE